jgi:PAS domain S-box-containing protein
MNGNLSIQQELKEEILRLRKEVARLSETLDHTMGQHLTPTEHKHARLAEERFKRLVQNSTDIIAVTDQDGILTSIYGPLETILGYKPEEMIGTNSFEFVCDNDRSIAMKVFNEALVDPDPLRSVEFRCRHKDGNWVVLEAVGANLIHDPVVSGIVLNIRDISSRIKAEEDLIRLSIAIEQAAEEVVITDPNGTIQYVNPAFEMVTGYSRQEAIGQTPRIVKSGAHDETFYAGLWKTITDGQVWKGHFTNRRKDGRLVQEDATISPITTSSGEIIGFVSLKRDISDELRLKAQLMHSQKMEAVGTLAGGIAHDFNNILTVLIGCASLLQSEIDVKDPMRAIVDEMLAASRRALNLTRSLVVFSRQHDRALTAVDLNEKIRGMGKLLKRLITEDISLEIWTDRQDIFIMADTTQIDQVLINLVTNARDAMPDGGLLTIETRLVVINEASAITHGLEKTGTYALVVISDTGHGMDEATKEKIFEPFFTTKDVGKGTGLGLATVYGIVRQHEGFIIVESRPGQGTSFEIYLPVIKTPEKETDDASTLRVHSEGTEIILVAEDNEGVRNSLCTLLKRNGYNIVEALDGQDAVEKFKERPGIALVILDTVMPRKNGREAYEEIHRVRPDVKIIFTSGYTQDIVLDKGIRESDFHFLRKPLSPDTLLRAVREVLDG